MSNFSFSLDTSFVDRHIGSTPVEQERMLSLLGVASLEELMDRAVPQAIRTQHNFSFPCALTEREMLSLLQEMAQRNEVFTSLIGMGYANTIIPPVILRNVLENPAWYTAYTPYQPEISQGRLEALLNFQTLVADLTGMELANASLLDEATAAAEGMTMCRRVARAAGETFLIDVNCHPQTIDVVETRAAPLGIETRVLDLWGSLPDDLLPKDADSAETSGVFGALLQYPGSDGVVRDLHPVIARLRAAGAATIVSADLLSLVLLRSPGEMGADIVVGSAQRFGTSLGFGGPHAGYIATAEKSKRMLPGRLVGVSKDSQDRRALRLALQTREQHIRREKATSNICTAQVLLAVMAGFYAVYHGPEGLRRIARRVHLLTVSLAAGLRAAGVEVVHRAFFDTLTVRVPGRADEILAAACAARVNLRRVDADTLGISLDETTLPETVEVVAGLFAASPVPIEDLLSGELTAGAPAGAEVLRGIPAALVRTGEILDHPVFRSWQSETGMLRYLRSLADKDLALDRTMIPLGSCTMKLNATAEMIPVTWPEFADIHPFAPLDQAEGYLALFCELKTQLQEITGYDAVSLQPNAGSQGEYAGLLAIRRYHESRGEGQRKICLVPASAHGTNAASAVMAGFEVVVVACDEEGNVSVEDLTEKAVQYAENLAALMVTYPSTHGVYEPSIGKICEIIHDWGGQVYLDGANLNALVGVGRPAELGADVSHFNLHKTFCIPHGGGGPGVGPIGVRQHLAPFLPNHVLVAEAGPETGVGAIAAAPWGSASILPISWAYIRMMGASGLRKATETAVLHANYVARRLLPYYPVLYTGLDGLVAHECILDVRPLRSLAGVTVDDVAKRLIDYGFHAPTMSFPVAGTLMIEPTESEPLEELDRFCEAMIAIQEEARRVAAGEWPVDDNPLCNAPHSAEDVTADEWSHPYSRELAAYPMASLRANKYWPPVSRVDGAYGDRHLMCACPPF